LFIFEGLSAAGCTPFPFGLRLAIFGVSFRVTPIAQASYFSDISRQLEWSATIAHSPKALAAEQQEWKK
jgi:hypothetical protein